MNRIAISMVMISLILLISIPTKASFSKVIEDERGDVINIITNGSVDKPNLDIVRVTYYQYEDGRVVLSLEVDGKIDDMAMYEIDIDTTDGNENATYRIVYTKNPKVISLGMKSTIYMRKGDNEKNLTGDKYFEIIDGKILRIFFNLFDKGEVVVDIAAVSSSMPSSEEDINEWCIDISTYHNENYESQLGQQSQQNNQENEGNEDGKDNRGFPGFVLIVALFAVAMAAMIFGIKKNL